MGFWNFPTKSAVKKDDAGLGISLDLLHKQQCNVCPLKERHGILKHPDMKPFGTTSPDIYMIGEAPGAEEDKAGVPFVGPAGRKLHQHIPRRWEARLRWNNVVRTRPPENRTPERIEIECCFPAETLVQPIGEIRSVYRRWYDGPMVTVKTRSGRVLTGTPNHPVFLLQGQTALQNVKVGDYAFCASGIDRNLSWAPNDYDKPAPIGQIFGAFFKPGQRKRVSTALDFHGDGMPNGEVDIVRTTGQLRNDFKIWAQPQQGESQPLFTFTDPRSGLLMYSRALDADFIIAPMIVSDDAVAARVGCVPSLDAFTDSSGLDAFSSEPLANKVAAGTLTTSDAFVTGNTFGSFASQVSRNNVGFGGPNVYGSGGAPSHGAGLATRSQSDSLLFELFSDGCRVGTGEFMETVDTESVSVELDQIVSVEVRADFRGHVYNLETESHKYMADGLVVSNCRPSIVKDIELTKPKAIFGFGNVPLDWVTGQTGITKWTGRKVPVRIGKHLCWFYPMLHPSYVMRSGPDSETEFQFRQDMARAFAEVEAGLTVPIPYTRDDAMHEVAWVTGDRDEDFEAVIQALELASFEDVVGLDYECNGLRPYRKGAAIQTVAIAGSTYSFAFPLDHKDAGWSKSQREKIDEAFEHFLYEAPCSKIVHNLAYELEWTGYFYGKHALRAQRWDCTMSQAFILDARQGMLSLERLGLQYFGINIKKLNPVDTKRIAELPLHEILPYNAVDAKFHLLLYLVQNERLKHDRLLGVYREHLRRIPTAVLTQMKGVPINPKRVANFHRDYTELLQDIADDIAALPEAREFEKQTGKPFRPSSNRDVKYVVNEILGQSVENVDKLALGDIKHPFVELELEWREIAKLISTYIEPLLPEAPDLYPDGKLHPVLQTTKVITWRTSSDSPNIQNFPKHQHREMRRQVARGGEYRIVSFDYSGIQARNVAMESKDETLVRYYWERYDIHQDWMHRIIKRYPKWLPKNADKETLKLYRSKAKNGIVFPSFFGAQKKKIATVLGIPENAAGDLHEEFWDEFPDIKKWHDRLRRFYQKHGYVTGLTGFRRRAPVSPTELINAPIQADEVMIVCDAMNRLSELEEPAMQANLMVHDDLTFCWPRRDVEKNAETVIRYMLDCPYEWARIVPLGVEMSVGKDWGRQEAVGEFYSDQDKYVIEKGKIV